MNEISQQSSLSLGNIAFRNGDYSTAIAYYKKAAQENPEMADAIAFNIINCEGKLKKIDYPELSEKSIKKTAIKTKPIEEVELSSTFVPLKSLRNWNETQDYLKEAEPLDENFSAISKSGLFDKEYYYKTYVDVANSGINPIEHYCNHGWQEHRNPSPNFNSHYYLGKNQDVAQAGVNPFVHWIKYGRHEGRKANIIEIDTTLNIERHTPTLLFVSHEASQTGAPAVLLTLMKWLKENTSIKFSILVGASGPWNERFKQIAPCFFFDDDHPQGFEEELKFFCGSDVSTIYINTIAAGLYAKHLDYLDAELITHVHEMENLFEIFADSFDYIKQRCNKYIAVSQGSVDALNKRLPATAEISFLKPFIDKRPAYASAASRRTSKFTIFGCGAVERRKGFDLFCDVAAQMLKMGFQDFKMYWIGSAENKDLIPTAEIHKHNVSGYVEWLGPQENVRDHFVNGNVFLLPSREDPYPLVCMEAAECRMPVICFDAAAGGMHSFVEADAGVVVPYLDTRAMASAVIDIYGNNELRDQMGKMAAKKVAERHYVSVVAPKIMTLFPPVEEILEPRLLRFARLIDESEAVSFDIFDTLVTRRISDPAVAFDLIEFKHTQNEPALVPLFQERMNTAGQVLASHNGKVDDISIDDIYKSMPFFKDSSHEKGIEIALCVPHPLGIKLYNYARKKKKKIYIASDMYLDQTTIESILRNCGITHWDELYLSSSIGKKKDTGKLFALMIEKARRTGISANKIFHIGDNWTGDVRQPKLQGLAVKRFSPINETVPNLIALNTEIKKSLSQAGKIWESFCTQSSRLWHKSNPGSAVDFYTKLGFELTGPLASMMAMHTAIEARKGNVKKVVFMARDGRIIKKAFDSLYREEISCGIFDSCYLHLSRATVVPATFSHPLSANDVAFLTEGLHLAQKPISYFIEKAGLSPDNKDVAKVVYSRFDSFEYIPTWNDLGKMGSMFDALSQQVFDANKIHRDNLRGYLEHHGLLSCEKIIVVDVGWLLNIHSRLKKFLKAEGSHSEIIGCYVGSRDRADKSLAVQPLLFNGGDPYQYSSFIEKHTTLFEVLFSAPEASAKALSKNARSVSPQFKPLGNPLPNEILVAQKLHMGAEAFFEMLTSAREDFFPEVISKDYFFHIFEALVNVDNDAAKATLGSFEVRLGGHHEFISYESLIAQTDPTVDYVTKPPQDEFSPITTTCRNPKAKAVIVTSAGTFNGSTRYRSLHLAEVLKNIEIESVLLYASLRPEFFSEAILDATYVIFQRCFEEQGNIGEFLKLAKAAGKICVGEMDDLVFPEHIETIGSVKGGEWNLKEALHVASGYEKLIKKMDQCIASTPVLKSYIETTYKKPTLLLRNRVLPEILRSPKQKEYRSLNLLYASGTYSHKADFMMIEETLFELLSREPHLQLSILGAAQASERILALNNVSSYPLLPYHAMLDFFAKHDVLLVPLEDTIFNRAKSTVKFIEAAAVGLPILASAVGEFNSCIAHRSNGLLAKSVDDWKNLLNELTARPKQLKNLAKNANQAVRSHYLTTSGTDLVKNFLFGYESNERVVN
ncbi:glycosyltransferase [Pseudomonas alabamensis]|uniref:glycosyltransferase n=1 Tax=Pseudomonas alabamensis TaxID=3064349 RepID=UPI00155FAE65